MSVLPVRGQYVGRSDYWQKIDIKATSCIEKKVPHACMIYGAVDQAGRHEQDRRRLSAHYVVTSAAIYFLNLWTISILAVIMTLPLRDGGNPFPQVMPHLVD